MIEKAKYFLCSQMCKKSSGFCACNAIKSGIEIMKI